MDGTSHWINLSLCETELGALRVLPHFLFRVAYHPQVLERINLFKEILSDFFFFTPKVKSEKDRAGLITPLNTKPQALPSTMLQPPGTGT